LNVAFSSAGSNDPDGSIVTYLWDFGDGTNGTGANPSHLYTSIGTYNVILTVTDNSGDSDTASVTVTVNAVSAASLRTNITMSSSSKRGVSSVKAVVLVTNGQGGAERSAIVNGKWTLPDGSYTSRYEYSNRKGKATFSTPANMDGIYLFEIYTVTKSGFAWDELGSETSDSFTLGNGGGNQPPIASFTDNCTALACSFNGSGSSDPPWHVVLMAPDLLIPMEQSPHTVGILVTATAAQEPTQATLTLRPGITPSLWWLQTIQEQPVTALAQFQFRVSQLPLRKFT